VEFVGNILERISGEGAANQALGVAQFNALLSRLE
jgi:hypothetical protein